MSYASHAWATSGSMAPVARSQSRARASVGAERAEDGLERAELAAVADHVLHLREVVEEQDRRSGPSGRSAGGCRRGRGTCSRRRRRGRSAGSRGSRPGRGWSTRCRRRRRGRSPGARGCSSPPTSGRSAAGRGARRSPGRSSRCAGSAPRPAPCRAGRWWPSRRRRGGPCRSRGRARRGSGPCRTHSRRLVDHLRGREVIAAEARDDVERRPLRSLAVALLFAAGSPPLAG